ncbi:hypothetical protein D3OALGA1CA_5722 [Olavius algarvensis associated proteobacterium Delta 3]|nr:hypothetical protein D3OALGB2SA_2455 [Olavius algarvensis associated proteobacterium Delta 3]CAB5170883.1 hypothetical protein D3OALGA1CA_5722 [Olavius algarvensis associated proteobacterium Delta 3]
MKQNITVSIEKELIKKGKFSLHSEIVPLVGCWERC